MVTEPIDGVTSDMPTLRDPDRLTYYKEEVGGLVMGGYEAEPDPLGQERHSQGFPLHAARFQFRSFRATGRTGAGPGARAGNRRDQDNWSTAPKASPPMAISSWAKRPSSRTSSSARASTPMASPRGAARAWRWRNGWPRASRPLICGQWISAALAARISTPTGSATRTVEAYGKHYTMAWPFEEHSSGRPCRKSPLYDKLLRPKARVSARSWAGSGPTGLRPTAPRQRTSTASGARTGSRPSAKSTRPAARPPSCSTRLHSPSSPLKGRMPRRR